MLFFFNYGDSMAAIELRILSFIKENATSEDSAVGFMDVKDKLKLSAPPFMEWQRIVGLREIKITKDGKAWYKL